MSTKSSYLYGEDFHFYFDYADMKFHLTIGKGIKEQEIQIPKTFIETLVQLTALKRSIETVNRSMNNLNRLENYYLLQKPKKKK